MIAGDPGLTPERWQAVKRIVQDALDRPPAERPAVLDRACGDDAPLRREVESLLAAAEAPLGDAGDMLERPAAAVLGASWGADDGRASMPGAPTPGAPGSDASVWAALAGRYALEGEIGRGGMATVYRVRDLHVGRSVALKVLRADVGATLGAERFRAEIRFSAGLHHEHILAMYDWGEAAGRLWFTMPYVEGESLRQRLERTGPLPVGDAVRIARAVASALAYMHGYGVVHRDVKPENILLLRDGHALVADFGIAKAIDAAHDGSDRARAIQTATGFVLGTPAYMSPEQAVGDRTLDARTDIYALGLVLYEMLAGVPAFAGAGPVALAAKQVAGPPPRLADVRPDLSAALDEAVARALQPAPADRYPTAAAFDDALGATTEAVGAPSGNGWERMAVAADAPRQRRSFGARWHALRRGTRAALGSVGAVAALGATVLLLKQPGDAVPLDPNRIVVFPLTTTAGAVPAGTGEDVATLVGAALDGTAPLRWIEASDYLDEGSPTRARPLAPADRRRLSTDHRAGYYVDGTIVRRRDSTTVVLRLYNVAADSVVTHRSASGRADETSVADLALQAVSELLVPLLEPGRHVDVSALEHRPPGAIAEFLVGERAYRASHFADALTHYRAALERDSLFGLAALQGAQAASWIESDDAAGPLARIALAEGRSLPPYRAAMARGMAAYLAGDADSAVAEFGRAIAFDSTRSEPWMSLGEVYRHLLPRGTGLESRAEQAFVRARQADTTFVSPLYHLAELAIRRGALARADTLARTYSRTHPESTTTRALNLSLNCARGSPAPSWTSAAGSDALAVAQAGVILSARPAYAACARAAFAAALDHQTTDDGVRWIAVLALQSLLVATGRDTAVMQLARAPNAQGTHPERLLILDALAGVPVDSGAAEAVRALGTDYRALIPSRLWLLGSWEGERGRKDRVRAIAQVLAAKADSSHARSDAVLARAIAARAALASGDTALAIRRLRVLTPSASSDALVHNPWECLGGERLLLARLLLAQHDYQGARAVAEALDAPHPITLLLYRRASLLLRLRAAAAMGIEDVPARAGLDTLAHAT